MPLSSKNKKIIFVSTIIFDSLLKLLFLLPFFFFIFIEFFIFFSLIFLILVAVLIRGLLKNYKWAYELLIGYGAFTFVLCIPTSIILFSLSFSQPIGSSEFIPAAFLAGIAFLLACVPTIIMIILAKGYKAQANIKKV